MFGKLRSAARAAGLVAVTTALTVLAACGGGGSSPAPVPAGLTYTSPVTTTVGVAMTALTPTLSQGASAYGAITYTVSPALPAGITISSGSGVISGTPTTETAQATYTITAANASGSTTFALSLKVDRPPPSAFTLSNLVSDGAVTAASTDPHLKNPWGLAWLPGGPMWVSNNQDQTSTIYDGTGLVQPLVVNIPGGVNGVGSVTGIVGSLSTTEFNVTNGTTTAPARFIFVTESGTVSGWAPGVDLTHALVAFDSAAGGAVYKGLAIATRGSAQFLYAADFHNNRIAVFDGTFVPVTVTGGFTDSTLPAGYAPFNIQAVQISGNTVLVVTYAQQDATATDEVAGAGLGLVNTFDLDGTLLNHLIPVGGALDAPWGVAMAPADFGTLSGALLIGNFGDGKINGFNASTGELIHVLADSAGTPIATEGLWGIYFGNGGRNQPTNVLYLSAGINGEADGLYARIDLGATAPDIVAPTGVAVTAPAAAASVSGTVDVTANATDNVGLAKVVFAVKVGSSTTEIGTDTTAPFSVSWNTGTVVNGTATLTATAFDAFGNTTPSAGVNVTVANVPDTTPPTVSITAPTGGTVSGTVTVSADAADNVGVSQVEFFAGSTTIGTDTTAPYSIQWNSSGFGGAQQLTAVARDGAGNTTTSAAVAVTVNNAPTLASLQSSIFTPRCSSCHTGSGASLPGSMNLSSASATFASLVNVDSLSEPAFKRVKPGDPDNSYVVKKLEGTQSVGGRMPAAGGFLDQATINGVRDWIQAGAAP